MLYMTQSIHPSTIEIGATLVYLVCKQHHDGVFPGTGRRVFDGERVIVVLDDVKVDVRLGGADHARSALDANADVP